MDLILGAFWFFLPAGVSNMMPVVAKKAPVLKNWDWPINSKIFGKNKTYRGIIFGTLVATLFAMIQYKITPGFYEELIPGFNFGLAALLGALLGFGALFGDLIESFCKRRRGVKPGDSWMPYDQIDYIIGAIVFSLLIVRLSILEYALIVTIFFGLHLFSVYIFYKLGVRDKPI